jgi:hypothetical protein
MQRLPLVSTLTLVGFLGLPSISLAQYNPYSQVRPTNTYVRPPVLSPYLNLLPVRPAGVNYFLNVRPEMDRRDQFNQIHSQLYDLERQRATPQQPVEDPLLPVLESTGHPVGFFNYAPYYNFNSMSPTASTNQFMRPPASRGNRGTR